MLAVVLAGFAGLVAGAGIVWLACGREVRRMARFLRERDARSNARLTVEAPGRSFAELASAVNGQLDAAQEERVAARRQQQEFQRDLASLSHDIRTPLMGAKGYLRLAQDVGAGFEGVAEAAGPHAEDAEGTAEAERAAGPHAEDAEGTAEAERAAGPHAEDAEAARLRRLAAAEARLDDMRALLDQLFAYAQANDPDLALDLRPVRVLPVLADVLVGQYPAFERQGWEPRVDFQDEALLVDADPEALARIFENLVVNALRHGVSAPTIEQRGGTVTFANEVSDPAALDVERLFERFYRADVSRTSPGSGLGLAVAASLAEAMGMRLDARLEGATLRMGLELWGC